MQALVIGDTEVARLSCALLRERGHAVDHLLQPTEAEVRDVLCEGIAAVAVLARSDVTVLRYALLIEHLRPGIRLMATVFDRTLAAQLIRVVPDCQVTSPAEVSLPAIVGACLGGDILALTGDDAHDRQVLRHTGGSVVAGPYRNARRPSWLALAGLVSPLRVHDDATRILLGGLAGLLAVLAATLGLASLVLHQRLSRALYLSTSAVAGVGSDNTTGRSVGWYLVFAACSMLLTIVFTAMFTAGIVNRLLSARNIGIVGARAAPRRDHVVIVGLGQVGMRLALRLEQIGIPTVVVERDPDAVNLRLANRADIPVLIAHAEDRAVLQRLGLARARALACMSSDELDNVEVAINALAVAPVLPIVLRAGEDDVIDETRSLFRVGQVCDVSALTALAVTRSLERQPAATVYARDHQLAAFDGTAEHRHTVPTRCSCQAAPAGPVGPG